MTKPLARTRVRGFLGFCVCVCVAHVNALMGVHVQGEGLSGLFQVMAVLALSLSSF